MLTPNQVKIRYRQLAFRQFLLQFIYLLILTLFVIARTFGNTLVPSYLTQFPVLNQQLLAQAAQSIANVTNAVVLCYTFSPARGRGVKSSIRYRYVDVSTAKSYVRPDEQPSTMQTLLRSFRVSFRSMPSSSKQEFCLQTAVQMYNMSSLTYVDQFDSSIQRFLRRTNTKLVQNILDHELNNKVLVFRRGSRLIVAFRGTVDGKQLVKVDMDVKLIASTIGLSEHSMSVHGSLLHALDSGVPKVHRGFYKSYMLLRNRLLSSVETSIVDDGPITEIITTGHSLGGALASLCSMDFITLYRDVKVSMYNYGSPKIGDYNFARYFNDVVPSAFRLVVDGDFIVGTPKRSSFITCACLSLQQYYHVGVEIVLDPSGSGTFIIEPSFVEKTVLLRDYRKAFCHLLSTYGRAINGAVQHCTNIDDSYDISVSQENVL